MNADMASVPQKRTVAASYLRLLLGVAVAVPWCFAGCVNTTPPWQEVSPRAGSGGITATGGTIAEAPDGPGGAGAALEAGVGGAIGTGGAGTGPTTGGSGGAIDGPGTTVIDEIDGGPGGTSALDLDAPMLDAHQVGTGGAAGESGGHDLAASGSGGAGSADGPSPSGGSFGTGGGTATGGIAASGGASGAGGAPGTGGTNANGGTSTTGSGGSTTGGGATGLTGTGGSGGTAGGNGSGGAAGANGSGGTGRLDAGPDVPRDAGPLFTGLVVYYDFESTDGATLPDVSGKGNNGALSIDLLPDGGTPKDLGYELVTSKTGLGKALSLHRAGLGYVRVPAAVFANAADLTVAVWVNVTTSQSWQRLFDIGIDAHLSQNAATGTKYLNIVPNGSDTTAGNTVFRITKDGYNNDQKLTGPSPSTGTWTHVALVLAPGGGGKLYLDGVEKDSQSGVTLRPADLGAIDYAFIGKSPFSADATFDGIVDEYRVYGRALSADEVQALYNFTGP
jgi:hypothetical protein